MTRTHNPPHPGETLREDVLPALGLNVTEADVLLHARLLSLEKTLSVLCTVWRFS